MTVRPRRSMVSVQPPAAPAASPTSTNLPLAIRTFDTTVRFASIVWIFPLVSSRKRPPGHGCADTTAGSSTMVSAATTGRALPMSHPFDIAEVFRTARCALVVDEVGSPDEVDLDLAERPPHATRPRLGEGESKRTSAATNARNRSTKSGFIA